MSQCIKPTYKRPSVNQDKRLLVHVLSPSCIRYYVHVTEISNQIDISSARFLFLFCNILNNEI